MNPSKFPLSRLQSLCRRDKFPLTPAFYYEILFFDDFSLNLSFAEWSEQSVNLTDIQSI